MHMISLRTISLTVNIEINIFKNYNYFIIKYLINIFIVVIFNKINIKNIIKRKLYYIID